MCAVYTRCLALQAQLVATVVTVIQRSVIRTDIVVTIVEVMRIVFIVMHVRMDYANLEPRLSQMAGKTAGPAEAWIVLTIHFVSSPKPVCFVLGHVARMLIVRLDLVVIRFKEILGGVFHMRIVAVLMGREPVLHVAQGLFVR